MKRMLALSLMIHLAGGMLFMFLAWIGERRVESSVYTVNLITPVPVIKTSPAEPKKEEEAPKIAKPTPVKPVPPKKAAKHPPDLPAPERKVAKLQKPVPSSQPPKPVVQPAPPPTAPETASKTPQPPAAPAPSDEASLPKPVAKAAIDIPHFKFPIYGAMIEKRISALWSPPPLAVETEGKETVVSFELNRSGRVKDV